MTVLANISIPTRLKPLLERAPSLLAKPLAIAPKQLTEPMLKLTLNHLFKDALADEEISFLHQKWLKLQLTDVNFHCFITVLSDSNGQAYIEVYNQLANNEEADVEFCADSLSLALLASKQVDPDTLFFQRKLMVTGKTELGLAIKNFLDDFDFTQNLPKPLLILIEKLDAKFSSSK